MNVLLILSRLNVIETFCLPLVNLGSSALSIQKAFHRIIKTKCKNKQTIPTKKVFVKSMALRILTTFECCHYYVRQLFGNGCDTFLCRRAHKSTTKSSFCTAQKIMEQKKLKMRTLTTTTTTTKSKSFPNCARKSPQKFSKWNWNRIPSRSQHTPIIYKIVEKFSICCRCRRRR